MSILIIVVVLLIPFLREWVWNMFLKGLVVLPCLVMAIQKITHLATRKCVWGEFEDTYPRRPGCWIMCYNLNTIAALASSVVKALTGVGMAAAATLIHELSVTTPSMHEYLFFSDSMYTYYLSILRIERLKLEIDRGAMSIPALDKNKAGLCKDTVRVVCYGIASLFAAL